MAPRDAKEVLALIKDQGIKMVDVRFTDMPGTWQHFSLPAGNDTSSRRQVTELVELVNRRSHKAPCHV